MNSPVQIPDRYHALWNESAPQSTCNLLRLSIIRELNLYFHSKRSENMALGKKRESELIQLLEKNLARAFHHDLSQLELNELIEGKGSLPERLRMLEKGLPEALPIHKFTRYDRKWEYQMASEVLQIGWDFWMLDAWILVSEAEPFHDALKKKLWPNGVVLFVEMAPIPADEEVRPSAWKGRWIIAQSPQHAQSFVENLPGLCHDSTSRPVFQRLEK